MGDLQCVGELIRSSQEAAFVESVQRQGSSHFDAF